jgi:hypothetical protein
MRTVGECAFAHRCAFWSTKGQPVKTTEAGGPRGYDGGKKVTGRKRQVLVDTEGNLLKTMVHPADIHDKPGGMLLLSFLHLLFPAITRVWADSSYQGLKTWIKGF